jgi:predicted RNA polymerase sigma factor
VPDAGPALDDAELSAALPRIVRILASWCGDLAVAEELTAEALARAVALPAADRPRDLVPWCVQVGRRLRIDEVRRAARFERLAPELTREPDVSEHELDPDGIPSGLDDRLALLFVACDPALTRENQLVLALRVVGGLPLPAVALHLGLGESATAARLTRAKRALAAARGGFAVPGAEERRRRLPVVLDCVAAMFTVAHRTSPEPPDALRDLGAHARSIADGLVAMYPGDPEVRGLRAVVLLGLARRPGRVDPEGVALTLDEVDRSRWDPRLLRAGLDDAAVAMTGQGRFALEAALSGLHATAPSVAATDWRRVVQLYETLGQVWGSPAVEVAELAARTQLALHRPGASPDERREALVEIEQRLLGLTESAPEFARRDAAFALADLRWRTGRRADAVPVYEQLLARTTSPSIRRFCARRLEG